MRNMKTINVWTSAYGVSKYGEGRFGKKIAHSEEFQKGPVRVSYSKDAEVSFTADGLKISFDVAERETAFKKDPIKTEFNYE